VPRPAHQALGRLRRSSLPKSRLRGSGQRRRSPSSTLRNSSSTSALTLTRQRANVSPVAPAARSSFHRARITAISSKSECAILAFVITGPLPAIPKKLLARICKFHSSSSTDERFEGFRIARPAHRNLRQDLRRAVRPPITAFAHWLQRKRGTRRDAADVFAKGDRFQPVMRGPKAAPRWSLPTRL
jgi:hypothetical protein